MRMGELIRSVGRSILVFALFSLVGPSLSLLGPFVIDADHARFSRYVLFQQFVFLLWPTWPLGGVLAEEGILTGAPAVIANTMLFGIMGGILGPLCKARLGGYLVGATLLLWIIVLDAWVAGFSFAYMNVTPIVMAFGLYMVPLWLLLGRRGPQRASRA